MSVAATPVQVNDALLGWRCWYACGHLKWSSCAYQVARTHPPSVWVPGMVFHAHNVRKMNSDERLLDLIISLSGINNHTY